MTTAATLHTTRSGRTWHVEYDGDLVVTDSSDPEHDLARALLARGITGMVELTDGITGTVRTRFDIEALAPWSVGWDDRDGWARRRYREPRNSDAERADGHADGAIHPQGEAA